MLIFPDGNPRLKGQLGRKVPFLSFKSITGFPFGACFSVSAVVDHSHVESGSHTFISHSLVGESAEPSEQCLLEVRERFPIVCSGKDRCPRALQTLVSPFQNKAGNPAGS